MAIATATAIAGASLALTAGSTAMSFAQAGKQKGLQRQAERDAELAMEEARKKLELNVYEGQGIKKEPYQLEREALLSAGAQAIQAGVESERGAAATAGRVMLAQQQAQAGVRTAMGAEETALENKKLAEESRLQSARVALDLGEVTGAQQAAAQAQRAAAQSTQQGFAGLQSLGQQAISQFLPLYMKDKTVDPLTGLPLDQTSTAAAQQTYMAPPPSATNNLVQEQLPPAYNAPSYLQAPQPFRFYGGAMSNGRWINTAENPNPFLSFTNPSVGGQ